MTDIPAIWVLWSERIGDRNQAEALARATGMPYELKHIEFHASRGRNIFMRSDRKFDVERSSKLQSPWPGVIIVVDPECTRIARDLRIRADNAIKIVKLGRPPFGWLPGWIAGRLSRWIDLVISPGQFKSRASARTIVTDLPFSQVNRQSLAQARGDFARQLEDLPPPRIAVLVGGSTKGLAWSGETARRLGADIDALARGLHGSLMISTSYRTGENNSRELMAQIGVPHVAYLWPGSAGPNPLLGYLAHADQVVVTMDSISMVSDAISTGKPVDIYRLPARRRGLIGGLSSRLFSGVDRERLYSKLVASGRVAWFGTEHIRESPAPPPDFDIAVKAVRKLVLEN